MKFISNSSVVGKHKTTEAEYLQDRDGVRAGLDPNRVTRNVQRRIKDYPEVSLSEDFFYLFIEQQGNFQRKDASAVLIPSDEAQAKVAALVATLPPARINVGISWRSGHREHFRNKSYTDLSEWNGLLSLQSVNFVNLQYSFEQDEIDEAERQYGIKIHTLPGIDLKDDLDEVVALCSQLEAVVTPGTALRELAGAVNAKVFSITSTRYFPDHYRLGPNDHDTIFPSMEHITALRYGVADKVLDEIGRRVENLALAKDKQGTP